jgi:hypothetical protein
MSANVKNMQYKDVRPDDVAKQRIWAFGEFRSAAEAHIPVLQPIDIGKRLYRIGDEVFQLETTEERDARWTRQTKYPRGGDAVRLAAPWEWGDCPRGSLPVGSIGIIDGYTEAERTKYVSITFHTIPFIGSEGSGEEHCSCSGGPGTVATPIGELQPTTDIVPKRCWMWKDGFARADNGAHYTRQCRVWNWYPNTVIIPEETPEQKRQALQAQIARCRQLQDVTPSGVVFAWELAGSSGASFELFREAHHTDEDIQRAKDHLRASRDVVRIGVTSVSSV